MPARRGRPTESGSRSSASVRTRSGSHDPTRDVWVVEAREGVAPRQVTNTPEGESGQPAVEPRRRPHRGVAGRPRQVRRVRPEQARARARADRRPRRPFPSRPSSCRSSIARCRTSRGLPMASQIAFLLQDDRRQQVATVPTARVSTRGVEPLTTGNRVIRAISPGKDGHFATLMTMPAQPAEIFALEGSAFRQLTSHNDALVKELRPGDDRRLPVPEQGRHRGAQRHRQARGLCGRAALPDDPAGSRRTQRPGRARLQLSARVPRGAGLRCPRR